jgi:GNAT superfamily N-acetyltransferase
VRIRSAQGDELDQLSELARRSKAAHGYSAEFLVAERSGRRLGFVAVAFVGVAADLVDLFVEPDRRGSGVGTRSFDAAVGAARSSGATRLTIEADPHAEDCYLRCGADRIGAMPSGSNTDRVLPVLGRRL